MAVTDAAALDRAGTARDYGRLLDYIRMEDRQDPLVPFSAGIDGVDRNLNRENIAQINQDRNLLDRIRARLESERLEWRLSNASKRRMVVPEERSEYAALFEGYCNDVVGYVVERLGLPNPYRAISTLSGPPEGLDDPAEEGIRAYLVHNIADEYIEEYLFSDASGQGESIRIKIRNRTYGGVVGSYTSNLVIGEDHHYTFVREPYTLWQNSATNPLNVFIVPIEETLHIALRGSTEEAIVAALQREKPELLTDVERIIEECMAVEEAMVGGLVSRLLPDVFERYLPNPPDDPLGRILEERKALDKYRYLERGIDVVADLGLTAAIELYRTNPSGFRALLEPQQKPAVGSERAVPKTSEAQDTTA